MPWVKFEPDDVVAEAGSGETLLEVALRAGVPMAHACGGKARCSTCRVLVVDGRCASRTPEEEQLAGQLCLEPAIRLACQTAAANDSVVRRLVIDEEDVALTSVLVRGASENDVGREKRVVIMFADIQGFTSFTESLLPYDVVHVLNRYFHRMDRIIRDHGGTISNTMGDGLLALFETADDRSGALQALRAALGMLESVDRMRPELQGLYGRAFDIRIGLHAGQVVAGALGTSENRRTTVIGDAVNLAARIEQANKQTGTRLLVSDDLRRMLGDGVRVGRTFQVELAGKSGRYSLYELTVAS